jgi:uncharacterized membrane-anchored protein YhcB (DUF1043 family)
MSAWAALLIGLWIGFAGGMVVASLLSMSKHE